MTLTPESAPTANPNAIRWSTNRSCLGPNSGIGVHSSRSWDNINGVAVVGGAQIPVRATTTYLSSPTDQTMIEQSNHDRVLQLVQSLAYWIGHGAFF